MMKMIIIYGFFIAIPVQEKLKYIALTKKR